jgi:hypothetical protein
MRFPEQHLSIACLCNLPVSPSLRVRQVADLYLAADVGPALAAVKTESPPDQLRFLTGTYRDANTGEVWRVSMRGSSLLAEFEGSAYELRQVAPTEFEPINYVKRMRVIFGTARDGTGRTLSALRFGLPPLVTFNVIREVHPPPETLAAYAGEFWSDEVQATYRLALKSDALWMTDLIGTDGVRRQRYL